jgi:hypothetical protein
MRTDPFKVTVYLIIAVLLLTFWITAVRLAIRIVGVIV